MKRSILVLLFWLSVAGICHSEEPQESGAHFNGNEPFRTFELLDSRLATLSKQQEEIKLAIFPQPTSKATSTKPGSQLRPWTKPAQNAQQSAKSIRLLAAKQQLRYAKLKQAYGNRAFGALVQKAAAVERSAETLKRTQDHSVAARQQALLEQTALSLVLQYQAITGGYGANHCAGKQHSCCQPKETTKAADQPEVGCNWVCVTSSANCAKGFTGP